jgi:hypothetical protein
VSAWTDALFHLEPAMTFEALRVIAKRLAIKPGNLADRIDSILDSGRINADDTIYLEKSAPSDQWDAIALASVCDLLAYSKDKPVLAWFARHGVTG